LTISRGLGEGGKLGEDVGGINRNQSPRVDKKKTGSLSREKPVSEEKKRNGGRGKGRENGLLKVRLNGAILGKKSLKVSEVGQEKGKRGDRRKGMPFKFSNSWEATLKAKRICGALLTDMSAQITSKKRARKKKMEETGATSQENQAASCPDWGESSQLCGLQLRRKEAFKVQISSCRDGRKKKAEKRDIVGE